MFISSYNTYVQTNTTERTSKNKELKEGPSSNLFATKFLNKPTAQKNLLNSTPINYVDNAKSFNNRQKLQQDLESKQGLLNANKFNYSSSLKNAKVAYTANSNMFSIVAKPKTTLSEASSIKENDASVSYKKRSAINTYLSNDKYYQITA